VLRKKNRIQKSHSPGKGGLACQKDVDAKAKADAEEEKAQVMG